MLMESDQVRSLQMVRADLEKATTELQQALAKKNVLGEQIRQVQESANQDWGVSNISQEVSEEDAKIRDLKNKKADLMVKYTERHPGIVEIDNLIEILQKQSDLNKKKSGDESGVEHIGPEKLSNPYVQTLKSAYDMADADVASYQALVDSLNERIGKLEDGLKEKLALETEMKNLNRDYDTISKQYSSLLERREQAHITERIDDQSVTLKFKIAEPPSRPLKPSFPNRILFYTAILILGLIIGFGVAFLICVLRPVYMSVKQVKESTGLPSLGSVSFVSVDKAVAKIDWIFIAAIGVLLIGYVGVMVTEILKK